MIASAATALDGTARLLGAGVALGSVELWQLRRVAADDGIWRLQTLRPELDALPLARALGWCLVPRRFAVLLVARLLGALLLTALGWGASATLLVPLLLATQLLVQLRWRGTFNGGSDFMTLILLSALTVAALARRHAVVATGALLYIAVQAATSYFLAGLAKLRRPSWRDGRALAFFAATTVFDGPPRPRALFVRRAPAALLGWATIVFECAFPLALVVPSLTVPLLAVGLAFHLGNAWIFGLNRFLFAWAAAYPAVYFASRLHG